MLYWSSHAPTSPCSKKEPSIKDARTYRSGSSQPKADSCGQGEEVSQMWMSELKKKEKMISIFYYYYFEILSL